MSLRLKLVVIITFVALVPLTISAFALLNLHQEASYQHVRELHSQKANQGASIARTYFDTLERSLTSFVQSIRWAELSSEERNEALKLTYHRRDDIVAVTLLDQQGRALSTAVYADTETTKITSPRHSKAIMSKFFEHIPFVAAQNKGVTLGEAFTPAGSPSSFLPIAFRVNGSENTIWIVAACVSLQSLCANLESGSPRNIKAVLLDPLNNLVCQPNAASTLQYSERNLLHLVPKDSGEIARFHATSGKELVAAAAEVSKGWSVVTEQLVSTAFATSNRMRTRTIQTIGLGILAALVVGFLLSQSIIKPIKQLVEGALEIAKGNFSFRLPVKRRDELGKLSKAFNHMGEEIAKREGEIRAWNEDLQLRVKENTQDLKEAQLQLLQSQKIAAIAAFGAGIAHEINNPLTGIVGLTQVMMKEAQKKGEDDRVELLQTVESEALRVKGIVRTLLSFSEDYAGEGFFPLDPREVLDESIEIIETEAKNNRIEIVRNYAGDTPKVLGNKTQLRQALLHLMNNSRTAMPNGGRLLLSTSSVDGQLVKISVTDTGKGIAPENMEKVLDPFFTTKDDWKGEGLGLTVAFRIIERHHGAIKPSSEVGKGTTMLITLPAAKRGAHLA